MACDRRPRALALGHGGGDTLPLILAVPVAIIAGVSRAAKRGVLVKGGGVLEVLATVRTIVIDKTGTLTRGEATLTGWHAIEGVDADELIRLAASLNQASAHVIGKALVAAALGEASVWPCRAASARRRVADRGDRRGP